MNIHERRVKIFHKFIVLEKCRGDVKKSLNSP